MGELELEHVTKVYGGDPPITAVEDINIEIKDGEFLVMVGPSGCGKSTTLRMIAGLEEVTDGNIKINDEIVNEQQPQKRDIAMVFQNYALYPHMTVRENMEFGLRLSHDLSDGEITDTVEETAKTLEIAELLDKLPKQLSGGQQQRVALGRAIVRDPAVFLMDEPLSNLDAKLRTQMRTELQRLQSDLGTTTVYVTHDQTEAMTMGDRIAILDDGELQQIAPPEECYDNPNNRFVAGFIGSPSMNFFEVSVTNNSSGISVDGPGFSVGLDGINLDSGEYTIGVRPEDFSVVETGGIEATVDVVEPMGSDNFLYLNTPTESEFTARVDSEFRPEEGDTVRIGFSSSEVHFFDDTGDRVNSDVETQVNTAA
ncbi:ABC transporter ATP-binding protein [Haladaptatus sp. GCM10025707]|uniref:ABC transporter ATP-binding protein n=1 Tax=unclassified Haladaptatus TaxID=2622732 RepID=UPI0023E8CB4D|nr:ABC transporter ATP-binding protein [Haladaptatus sp. QDMS2]